MNWADIAQVTQLWCSSTLVSRLSRTKPPHHMDLSAACLPACKSRVFVLGDVRVEQVVHYSLRYATCGTLFQSSRKESHKLAKKKPFSPNQPHTWHQKVRYRRILRLLTRHNVQVAAIYACFPVIALQRISCRIMHRKSISGTITFPSHLISAVEDAYASMRTCQAKWCSSRVH